MLERYLLFWLCLISGLAYFWPAAWLLDPFQLTRDLLPSVIVVTMFAVGWILPREEVQQVVRRWPLVLGGTAIQYLSMPLLALAIARAFPLPYELQLGIIMVGCVPGAMASNVLTLIARGNVSYSLSLTTAATLLSPLCVPIVLKLTMGQKLSQPLHTLVVQLLWWVVVPVVVGHLVGHAFLRWRSVAVKVAKVVASLAILWIIAVVVGVNRDQLQRLPALVAAAVLLLNLGGYGAGQLGARLLRLPGPMRRALVLEIGMQNAGLGTTLALTLFPDQPAATIPTALYTFGCMFTGTMLARFWSRQETRNPSPPDAAAGQDEMPSEGAAPLPLASNQIQYRGQD